MTHDELDRILSHKDEITPSSGFVNSVMDAVRQDASTPAPIPFPWRRALPGMIAGVIITGSAIAFMAIQLLRPDKNPMIQVHAELSSTIFAITAALLLTLASTTFVRFYISS